LAKAWTQWSDTYSTIPNPKKVHSLVREDLKPGDHVSLDQYVSSVPGRLAHTYGKEKKLDKLTGGTIFVDNTTGHVFIYNQVSASASETLIGKKKYERLALDSGVSVQTYHADNDIFATKAFRAHCDYKGQELEFSGVGAHHQNGVAERAIKTLSSMARTMLLHMSLHWPKQADLELWPFALEHASYLWNHLPRLDTRLVP
jgi:transposase InsO family protein